VLSKGVPHEEKGREPTRGGAEEGGSVRRDGAGPAGGFGGGKDCAQGHLSGMCRRTAACETTLRAFQQEGKGEGEEDHVGSKRKGREGGNKLEVGWVGRGNIGKKRNHEQWLDERLYFGIFGSQNKQTGGSGHRVIGGTAALTASHGGADGRAGSEVGEKVRRCSAAWGHSMDAHRNGAEGGRAEGPIQRRSAVEI